MSNQLKKELIALSLLLFLNNAYSYQNTDFVTTWVTVPLDKSVTLPFFGNGNGYSVDWNNDGVFDDNNLTGPITHTYTVSGTKTIVVKGDLFYINFINISLADRKKILSVEQWGNIQWASMSESFVDAENLVINAQDSPDLSAVTDLSGMFFNAVSLGNGNGNWAWNTSNIIDMSQMFHGCNEFNKDIGSWDTSKVTDMNAMFAYAENFNQPIGMWETSKVTDMNSIFKYASMFNQNIGEWKTPMVTDMNSMFAYAESFNQPIGMWETSKVTDMSYLFNNAIVFNQNIGEWKTPMVTDMNYMFKEANEFNQPIGLWNTSKVTLMNNMFHSADAFDQDISEWDTSLVTNMRSMFYGADIFNQNIGNWSTSKVADMDSMFAFTDNFNQYIGGWDTSKVIYMYAMFRGAVFNSNISNWDTSLVKNMSLMFFNATSFNQDIGLWNTSNVNDMSRMFQGASQFNHNIGSWNTSNVEDMENMFYTASLFNQDIGSWDTTKVTNMSYMFYDANDFNQDISSWNVEQVQDINQMFELAQLSTTNYDKLLIEWSNLNVMSNLDFSAGNSKYCSNQAVDSKQLLMTNFSWNIGDNGQTSLCAEQVDIVVTISSDAIPYIYSGDTITYSVEITNLDADDAKNIDVKQSFNDDIISVSWTCSSDVNSSCSSSGSTLIKDTINIAADESVYYSIIAQVTNSALSTITIQHQILTTAYEQTDFFLNNNQSTHSLLTSREFIFSNNFEE